MRILRKAYVVLVIVKRVINELPRVLPNLNRPPKFSDPHARIRQLGEGVYQLDVAEGVNEETLVIQQNLRSRISNEVLILHCFYEDVAVHILRTLGLSPQVDVILTGSDLPKLLNLRKACASKNTTIFLTENRGRDIYPFLMLCDLRYLHNYKVFWKVHTKKSPHLGYGQVWLEKIMASLLDIRLSEFFARVTVDTSRPVIFGSELYSANHRRGFNFFWLRALAREADARDAFVPGSMFIGNGSALLAIAREKTIRFLPEKERGQLDGTFVHAVERILGFLIRKSNGLVFGSRDVRQ